MPNSKSQKPEKPEFKGFIISYNGENGYGFVRGEDGEDYYFNLRAFRENSLPKLSQKVIFTLSNAPSKNGKNPAISSLKYDPTATQAEQIPPNKDDSRIKCPNCGKKIMPRMSFSNNMPVASYCPLCGGMVKMFYFQNKMLYVIIFIMIVFVLVFFGAIF